MAEEFDTKHTDDGYEDVCFICRRPESKAGKMFKMPGNMTVCMDCMQKTMETVSNMDYQSMLNNPAFLTFILIYFNIFKNLYNISLLGNDIEITNYTDFINLKEMGETMGNKFLDGTALTIAIIGAVNWGLIGLFRFDLVAFLFGEMSWISRIVYILVGICGLYLLTFFMRLGDKE